MYFIIYVFTIVLEIELESYYILEVSYHCYILTLFKLFKLKTMAR